MAVIVWLVYKMEYNVHPYNDIETILLWIGLLLHKYFYIRLFYFCRGNIMDEMKWWQILPIAC